MSDFTSPSLYSFDVSKRLGGEYVNMFNDVARFLVIQITIQFLLTLTDSTKQSFFSAEFAILLMYLTIGVLVYWLVFKKIVEFR